MTENTIGETRGTDAPVDPYKKMLERHCRDLKNERLKLANVRQRLQEERRMVKEQYDKLENRHEKIEKAYTRVEEEQKKIDKQRRKIDTIAAQLVQQMKSLNKCNADALKSIRSGTSKSELVVKKLAKNFASYEESLLMVMHNIKKNQFIYSHYPDEWVKNYLDVKKGLQDENRFLEENDPSLPIPS